MIEINEIKQLRNILRTFPMENRERNSFYTGESNKVTITNKYLSSIEANKSMQFECPNCKYTQITKAWNYIHNYCPHCGVKIIWDISE